MEYQSLSNDFHNCLIVDCLTLSWKYFMLTQEYVEIRTMWDNWATDYQRTWKNMSRWIGMQDDSTIMFPDKNPEFISQTGIR
jgi:hypothetical protein